MAQLRVGLTISGAISLGAYEGGALAALLVAVQEANREEREAVRVDAIAGASAGSITGVLAARTLLEGLDPVDVMWRSWVKAPDLKRLRAKGRQAPLSVEAIRAQATELLSGEGDPAVAQHAEVRLHMALAALRGLNYEIGRIGGPPLWATTYLDWGERTLRRGDPVEAYTEPPDASRVDIAMASGAHAAAFAAKGLDRSGDREAYLENHVTNFPAGGWLWYTDGGTLDNEPLGRALDVTRHLDGDGAGARRLHLLVSPDPEQPVTGEDRWSDRAVAPPWTSTLARTLEVLKAQSLYEDLARVEKTNSRLHWVAQLERTLLQLISERHEDPEGALQEVVDSIDRQKRDLGEDEDVRVTLDPLPATGLAKRLSEALAQATGLAGKQEVAVDIISPRLLPEVAGGKAEISDLLAGEILGHFGGFLDEHYRSNDFALGYRSTLEWLAAPDRGLVHQGVDPGLARVAMDGARARYDRGWETGTGKVTFGSLPVRQKLALLRVAAKTASIILRDRRRG